MKVHFIAIGGAAMHNLAIALHNKGYEVTGSDDEIFEPSRGRLKKYGLLPSAIGWRPEMIHTGLDAVILGMHARADNPELARAQKLGIPVFSYPEFLYEQSKDKVRVVIGGSHGKTTITAMLLHVMNYFGKDVDYMVGAQLEGFDVMVKLTDKARVIILEGDEYLTSPLDPRPKFHVYKPEVALISGIAWDHINVFSTFEKYLEQFRIFAEQVPDSGALMYCEEDTEVKKIAENLKTNALKIPYHTPEYKIEDGDTSLLYDNKEFPLQVFGKHNLLNIAGAAKVANYLGILNEDFFEAIKTFKGASKRLELIAKNDKTCVFKDFAHSPSKLKATTKAVKEQFPEKELVACMELHTFSSLNKEFLSHYKSTMDSVDYPVVYFNPHTIAHKKLPPISKEEIMRAFDNPNLEVFTDTSAMMSRLAEMNWENKNLLLMSSGNFNGLEFVQIAAKVLENF